MCASCVDDASNEAGLLSQEEALLVAARLHRVLRPFVLRRLKESVATELPPKVRCSWPRACHCVHQATGTHTLKL